MAKKRKSSTSNAMDVDPQPSVLTANTNNARIKKSSTQQISAKPLPTKRLPRGKNLRAQRQRKEKGAERAAEVRSRTERMVERSRGRGRRKGERNAKWEELNDKIREEVGKRVETKVWKGDNLLEREGDEWIELDGDSKTETGRRLDCKGEPKVDESEPDEGGREGGDEVMVGLEIEDEVLKADNAFSTEAIDDGIS